MRQWQGKGQAINPFICYFEDTCQVVLLQFGHLPVGMFTGWKAEPGRSCPQLQKGASWRTPTHRLCLRMFLPGWCRKGQMAFSCLAQVVWHSLKATHAVFAVASWQLAQRLLQRGSSLGVVVEKQGAQCGCVDLLPCGGLQCNPSECSPTHSKGMLPHLRGCATGRPSSRCPLMGTWKQTGVAGVLIAALLPLQLFHLLFSIVWFVSVGAWCILLEVGRGQRKDR